MKISIYNQTQDILVQTVSLQKNQADPLNTYLFFCPYCSYQLVQIQGIVAKLTPGLIPTDQVVVINKCPRCEMRYTTQTSQTQHQWTQTVLTRFHNPEPTFRCYICRTPILDFDYDHIFDLVDKRMVKLPYQRLCPNPKCPSKYFIYDVV